MGYNEVSFCEKEGGALKVNQIRAGAVLSYVSMALSTIISLVYTPIMLERLGDSEFGVYQAVLPIISYLNLLSFGLGSAYVRYYSRFRATGDKKGCAKLNGMFLITYLVLGAAVLVIGFGLSYCDVIFGKKLTAEEITLAEKLLRIMTVNAALTFPISVFESHVTINERYLFQKIVAMGKQVLNPLIMIPLLIIGYRSVTLTVVSLIFTILSGILNIGYCLTKLRMPFSFRRYDFGLLREMFSFTLYVFISIVVDNFNWAIDRQLLTWFQGSTSVTVYSIAAQLNTFYLAFGNAISNVMTPRVHRLVAENAPMRTLDACSPGWAASSSSCWAVSCWASWPSGSPLWCCGAAMRSSLWTTGWRCCCSSPACGPTSRRWASRSSAPRICTSSARWSIWAWHWATPPSPFPCVSSGRGWAPPSAPPSPR